MWLYVPSHSAPAAAASNSDSISHVLESLAPHCTWNGNSTRPASLLRAWKREACLRRLSGLTCEQSALQASAESWAESIASRAAIPANHFPAPASVVAKTIRGTYGPQSLRRLSAIGRACVFSRTSQATLLSDSIPFSLIYERWTTTLRRSCLQRRKSVLRTSGSGCSSWRSPQSQEPGVSTERLTGEPGHRMYDKDTGRLAQYSLTQEVQMWPTAKASTGDYSYANGNPGTPVLNLEGAAKLWQTPSDPTFKYRRQVGQTERAEELLPAQAENGNWATPQTWDATDCQTSPEKRAERKRKGGCKNLREEAVMDLPSSPMAPATEPDGQESSQGGQGSRRLSSTPRSTMSEADTERAHANAAAKHRLEGEAGAMMGGKKRLNPLFVTLLMNYPLGWPDPDRPIAPSNSDSSGTQSCLPRWRRLSSSCLRHWLEAVTE